MEKKYIINHEIPEYTKVDITSSEINGAANDTVVLILDESTSDHLHDYYEQVTKILTSGNKLYIIIVGKESKIRKAICTLACNYRNYNMYKVDSKDTVDLEYVETIIDREPTIDEVQSFIGGDIAAYGDINTIIIGIEDCVANGDLEGVKNVVEQHINSIEGLASVVDYMKKIVDSTNSKELLDRIEELKAKVREAEQKIDKIEEENDRINDQNLKLAETADASKRELARVMSKNKELEAQLSSNAPVITSYSELNTALIRCRATHVLYFKEVSYVQYTNSLIMMLVDALKIQKFKVKLMVYDSRAGLSTIYKPLSVIGGSEFVANKDNFISRTEAFVVVEPNPVILTSVLESNNPALDVVIIYDRMRQVNNLVAGNNVTRFFVINSGKDFKEVQNQLRITDKYCIISRVGSSIGPEVMNIPEIPGYNSPGTTNTAKVSKFRKLQAAGTNKLLFQAIAEKARISWK